MTVNYNHTVSRIVNNNCKNFIVKAARFDPEKLFFHIVYKLTHYSIQRQCCIYFHPSLMSVGKLVCLQEWSIQIKNNLKSHTEFVSIICALKTLQIHNAPKIDILHSKLVCLSKPVK